MTVVARTALGRLKTVYQTGRFMSIHHQRALNSPTVPPRAIRVFDGGTGEELLGHRGVPDDRLTWSAKAIIYPNYHDTLRSVHIDFLNAGSDYITVNNFGVTPGVFGSDHELIKKLTRMAGDIARQAADASATTTGPQKRVLASLPPLIESYRPDLALKDHALAVNYYRSLVIETLDALVDGWIAETLSSSGEVIDAMDAVSAHVTSTQDDEARSDRHDGEHGGRQRELFVSLCVRRGGLVRSGERASHAIRRIVEHWVMPSFDSTHTSDTARPSTVLDTTRRDQAVRLSAVLFNCSQPEDIAAAFEELHHDEQLLSLLDAHSIRLGCYPNRLTAIQDDWTMETSTEPQATRTDFDEGEFVDWAMDMMTRYTRVQFVGGCCGIGPSHIRALRRALTDHL